MVEDIAMFAKQGGVIGTGKLFHLKFPRGNAPLSGQV
jgi:hypothetical protein